MVRGRARHAVVESTEVVDEAPQGLAGFSVE